MVISQGRLESQILRGKEIAEKFQKEVDELKMKESSTLDELKKHARQMRYVLFPLVLVLH